MANIKNDKDLELWFEKETAFIQAMVTRIALRVLPIYSLSGRNDLTLSAWRASFISWAAHIYPVQINATIINDTAIAALTATDAVHNTLANSAGYAVAYAVSQSSDSGHAARTALHASNATLTDRSAIYVAIQADAEFLETKAFSRSEDATAALMSRPLWPATLPPPSISLEWKARQLNFSQWGEDWDIWIDWYDQRLKGSENAFARLPIPYDYVTASIAAEGTDFWNQSPELINANIKHRLDHAVKLETKSVTVEALPGYYSVEIENDRLTAKPVAPETAKQEFARDMLEALRELVDDTRLTLDQVQDDTLLIGLLDRLGAALTPDINDLRIGRLSALHSSLTAQAAAHDDPSRESHSTIRGALNGLSDTLEKLLAQFEAVREAKASQVALQINTSDLPALENAVDQFTAIIAQSDSVDISVINALNEGRSERFELDILTNPLEASPQRLQAITSQRLNLNGQRLVTVWNVTTAALKNVGSRFGKGAGDGAEELGKELTINAGRAAFLFLLHKLNMPLAIIAMLVPSFIKPSSDIKKLDAADKKSDTDSNT